MSEPQEGPAAAYAERVAEDTRATIAEARSGSGMLHRYEEPDIVRSSPVGEALGAVDYETEMLDTVLGSLIDRLQPYRSDRPEKEDGGLAANPRERHGEHVERIYGQAARIASLAGAVRRVLHDLDL